MPRIARARHHEDEARPPPTSDRPRKVSHLDLIAPRSPRPRRHTSQPSVDRPSHSPPTLRCTCTEASTSHARERRPDARLAGSSAAPTPPAHSVQPRRPRPRSRSRPLASTIGTASVLAWSTLLATPARAAPPSHSPTSPPEPLTPRRFEKSRAIEDDGLDSAAPVFIAAGPTPPPLAPSRSKRQVPAKYEYSDGEWVLDTAWTLRGSTPSTRPTATRQQATAMAENFDLVDSSGTASESASSTRSAPVSSTRSPYPTTPAQHAAAAASSTVSIPAGWQSRPRETDYYAVPVIIAMSVLVAIAVVGAILGSVCWRKKKRRRRDVEKDVQEKGWRGVVQRVRRGRVQEKKRKRKRRPREERPATDDAPREDAPLDGDVGGGVEAQSVRESIGSAGSGSRTPRIVRTTGFAAVSERVRPRRRHRRRGQGESGEAGGASDDEATALTRTETRSTTSSAGVRDTLTARLASSFQGSGPSLRDERSGSSTVFSRMPDRNRSSASLDSTDRFPRTSTQDSHLSRSSFHVDLPPPPTILFTPADDPALSPGPPGSPSFATSTHSLSRVPSRTLPPPMSPALSTDPLLPATPGPAPITTPSLNAMLAHDADLSLPLAPGPPAYRPASSTVQSTRRYGAGQRPVIESASLGASAGSTGLRGVLGSSRRRREARQPAAPVQEEWHWPGEKGRALDAGQGGASTSSSSVQSDSRFVLEDREDDELDAEVEGDDDAEETPPVDRSMFQAHLATDDKAVLDRIRNGSYRPDPFVSGQDDDVEAGSSSLARSVSIVPTPSAPPQDDDDVDADGFERFDPRESLADADEDEDEDEESRIGRVVGNGKAKVVSPRLRDTSILPAPPSRIDFTYPYLASGSSPSSSSNAAAQSSTRASVEPSSDARAEKSALAAAYAEMDRGARLTRGEEGGKDEDDEDDERDGDLPDYLPRPRDALGLASAPPAVDSDDEEDQVVLGDVVEGQDGRTHRVV
ncbi:hypothetical protein JCM10212_001123 [Sporobolomyces blumeae]